MNTSRRKFISIAGATVTGCLSINLAHEAFAQSMNTEPTEEQNSSQDSSSTNDNESAISESITEALSGWHLFWIMTMVIMGPIVTILSVILGPFLWSDNLLEDRAKYLSSIIPKLLEGITILLIISTLILASILGISLPSGTLSILSAIAGYVLGKSQSRREESEVNPSARSTRKRTDELTNENDKPKKKRLKPPEENDASPQDQDTSKKGEQG